MKLIVNPHKIELIQEEAVNEKEIDISKCEFEFDEEITEDYVKEAYFTLGDKTYKQVITNNQCSFPQEVLVKPATIELGVVAYLVENETEIKRYNPTPVYFKTDLGSLKTAQNSEPITPSEMEQYEQALQDGLQEVANVDIDASKVGDTATITITNRQGTQKSVQVQDGADGEKGDPFTYDDFTPEQLASLTGPAGADGKDGVIQYTAGENITIVDNIISAVGGTTYTAGNGITINNDKINVTLPVFLLTNNGWDNPLIIEDCTPGMYLVPNSTVMSMRGYANSSTQYTNITLINGFVIITNTTIDKTKSTWQPVGYIWGSTTASNSLWNFVSTLSVRGTTGQVGTGTMSGYSAVMTTGNASIDGIKTFNSLPECSATPTTNNQFTNKKYVDDKIWIGTQEEYDNLSTYSNNTVYFIKEE